MLRGPRRCFFITIPLFPGFKKMAVLIFTNETE